MDKRKRILKTFIKVLSAVTLAAPLILYHFLLRSSVEGALAYGKTSYFFVMTVSVIFSLVPLTLWRFTPDPQKEEDDEEWDYTAPEEISEESENVSLALEEYPELFLGKVAEEEKENSPSYLEALGKAIASQKAEYVPEEDEGEEDNEIFSFEKSETIKEIPDIYSDIPDTLPEGYEIAEESEEEKEETDEPQSFFEEGRGTKLKKVFATVLSFLIPLTVAFAMSKNYVVYSEDGFTVSTPFEKKTYIWQFCRSFEIGPSFFGDGISFELQMNDGEKIELLPSDLRLGDGFYEKYESEYAYSVSVSEKLIRAGAKKSVREKNVIENGLALREDIGEDIKKLID